MYMERMSEKSHRKKRHGKTVMDEKSQEKSHKKKVTGKKFTYIMSSFR
jgi:hypothetical protein